LTAIKDCCSGVPDFISSGMPVLTGVFHLLLANGNQPLAPEEFSRQLNERRRGYPISPETLTRLLENDRYYGLRPAPE
jgi:hypothetical protein